MDPFFAAAVSQQQLIQGDRQVADADTRGMRDGVGNRSGGEITLVPSKRSVRLISSASVSLPLVRGSPGVERASRKRIGSPV